MSAEPLHIAQVNTSDRGGGAERVASDLHAEYLRRGHDAWMLVGDRRGDDSRVLEIDSDARRSRWQRSLRATSQRLDRDARGPLKRLASRAALVAAGPRHALDVYRGVEDFDYPGTAQIAQALSHRPDVWQFHNLHGYYFDIRALPALTSETPGVLTMHDAWALTGHCAHPFECERWLTGCGDCPDLGMYVPIRADASATSYSIKHDSLSRSRLVFCTPSRWLMSMVERSGLLEHALGAHVVPNGVRHDIFKPGDRLQARRRLGLPPDAKLVLFAANALQANPFKDYATLERALSALADAGQSAPTLIALGVTETVEAIPNVIAVPYVSDPAEVADYYRAADVYVHASLAENHPLAVIEAMACGTPVVASDVGGVSEIAEHGVSGLLVPPGDADALTRAIGSLLGDADLRDRFSRAGLLVARELTVERQADAYLGIFSEIAAR